MLSNPGAAPYMGTTILGLLLLRWPFAGASLFPDSRSVDFQRVAFEGPGEATCSAHEILFLIASFAIERGGCCDCVDCGCGTG